MNPKSTSVSRMRMAISNRLVGSGSRWMLLRVARMNASRRRNSNKSQVNCSLAGDAPNAAKCTWAICSSYSFSGTRHSSTSMGGIGFAGGAVAAALETQFLGDSQDRATSWWASSLALAPDIDAPRRSRVRPVGSSTLC